MALTIFSPEFKAGGPIPAKFTCQGEQINPTLNIENIPGNTKSLALIVDDPDAPMPGGFVHWVLFNISPTTRQIAENSIPPGATQGNNSAGNNEYIGPCPPTGRHRYFFKLYALDSLLDLNESAARTDMEAAMDGHIIEQAELIGTYQKI